MPQSATSHADPRASLRHLLHAWVFHLPLSSAQAVRGPLYPFPARPFPVLVVPEAVQVLVEVG
jgi:hypothetical protein